MVTTGTDSTLIDLVMPRYDVTIAEHAVVHADSDTTYRATRSLDLLRVHTPLLDAAMWVRQLPMRLTGRAAPPSSPVVVGDGLGIPGWLVLGEREGLEIVLGAVGRFWRPVIDWRTVDADEFAHFAEPGWGKIAAGFSMFSHGPGNTVVTYECRTATTDPASRRSFARYWWLVRPFVAHILRATLKQIKNDAEVRDVTHT